MNAKIEKIALVTGANRGIGFETARQLGQAGIHVILASRDLTKAEDAAKKLRDEHLSIEPIYLDVTNIASIQKSKIDVESKYGHLDIIVNNAGILIDGINDGTVESTLQIWKKTFESNVFGLIAVTLEFLPLLKKSKAGRIVNLSSILASHSLHSDSKSPIYHYKSSPSYNASKSSVNAWTLQLSYELANTHIKVNAAHPGHVKTDMSGPDASMDITEGAKTSVQLALLGPSGPTGGFFHLGQKIPW